MKNIYVIGLVFLLMACTSTRVPPTALTACSDKRSPICTREYRPVCGFDDKMRQVQTYSNACTACADKNVLGHTQGACK